jgi:hypothetical protein
MARDTTAYEARPPAAARPWPGWAQAAVSVALAYHMTAVLAGALAVAPSSGLQRRVSRLFRPYYELTNQGYGYRYYARLDYTVDPHNPRPWGTPVVFAEMHFDRPGGGTDTELVRLPGRPRQTPRLRHQRQLDLAYHLAADHGWAASYARHLIKTRGCQRVALYRKEHHVPDLAAVRQAASGRGGAGVDLEGESTYGPRIPLGEFRCAEF